MPDRGTRFAWSTPSVCQGEFDTLRSRRIGRFLISMELIEQHPAEVLRILGGCIVVRAEVLYMPRAVEYCALHDAFEPMEPGPEVPLYMPVLGWEPGDNWTVTWHRA